MRQVATFHTQPVVYLSGPQDSSVLLLYPPVRGRVEPLPLLQEERIQAIDETCKRRKTDPLLERSLCQQGHQCLAGLAILGLQFSLAQGGHTRRDSSTTQAQSLFLQLKQFI